MALAPIMLTAEQFSCLATKDDLKNFATKDDLKNFATKKEFQALSDKLDLRFEQLDYKIESIFNNLSRRSDRVDIILNRHEHDIQELKLLHS